MTRASESSKKAGKKEDRKDPTTPKDKKETESAEPKKAEELSGAKLLDQFGDALLNAGNQAEKLGRWGVRRVGALGRKGVEKAGSLGKLGVAKAELEKERFALASAYEDLGKEIASIWQDSPNTTLRANSKAIVEPYEAVKKRLEKIAEIEKRMETLRQG